MISNKEDQQEVCVINTQQYNPTSHISHTEQDFPKMKNEQKNQDSDGSFEPSQPPPQSNSEKFYLFLNQVGGHNTLLKPIDDSRDFIVKPAQTIEIDFYQQMQERKDLQKLKKFIPKFYGTVEINNASQIQITNDKQNSKDKNSTDNLQHLNSEYKSSWIQGLFSRRFKYGQYMKLQDLTKNKKYPCVLDLKMGFTATCEKDIKKFQNSTSSSLGFRFCGMNVYYPLKKTAIFRDKYWGRNITYETLKNCMQSYFYDGEQIRTGLIQRFIDQLNELKDVISNFKGYKFYSSSLLLIFDAIYNSDDYSAIKYEKQQRKPSYKQQLQMRRTITQENKNTNSNTQAQNKNNLQKSKFSFLQKENNPNLNNIEQLTYQIKKYCSMEKSQSIDQNIINTKDQKLPNLDNIQFGDIYDDQSFDSSSDSLNNSYLSEESNSNFDNNFLKKENSKKSIISSHSDDCLSFKQSKPCSLVKLIDFANIEIDQNDDKPDQELLKGLENLINLFEEIKSSKIDKEFLIENQKLIQSKESDELKKKNAQDKLIKSVSNNINNFLKDSNHH